MPQFVDSHCHLTFPGLAERWPEIKAAMRDAQVVSALCACTQMEEAPQLLALVEAHPELWGSVGVHPDQEEGVEPTVDDLVQAAQHPKVVAIGECGLDYYRLGDRSIADMGWQRDRLRCHVQAARRVQLPLIIHTRSSAADTLAVLKDEEAGAAGGVFHCFTESADVARAALDLGFYISFSGILSFKNAADLREVARMVPLDRCLIETDSPYLAPVPYRGKTNMPAYVPHVAAALADAKGLSVEAIAQATTHNFYQLFSRARPGSV